MSALGGFAKPGQGAALFTTEREIVCQGFEPNRALYKSAVISGATRDAGNSLTHVLRPGLLLGVVTSTGEYEEWDADASDGTQFLAGVLWKELRATDFDANNTDRVFTILVGGVPLIAGNLLVQGTAMTSATDEPLARRVLKSAGFWLDDDPMGYLAGAGFRFETQTGTSHTLTKSDNGKMVLYSSASAVLATLPTILPGLEFDFVRVGDEELVVASAEGDNMIVGNDLSADSVTWTTASQQIGARLRVKSVYMSTTLKWLTEVVPAPYSTGAFLASSIQT